MSEEPTKTRSGSRPDGDAPPNIPDFDLLRVLGKGGFGQVWLARSKSGVCRAVKVLAKGDITEVELEGLRTFETYARGHPHLIDIRHVGETDDCFYYVMELADSYRTEPTFSAEHYEPRTLRSDLRRKGALPLAESIEITCQILDALDHLHRHELLHRDIKPGNIVFVDGAVKLADIGLMRRDARPEYDGYTPLYAPKGGVTDRSGDLYCLGRVLYAMVSGVSPDRYPEYPADADAERRAALTQIMPAVNRACAPNAADRFQSTTEFVRALESVLGHTNDVRSRSLRSRRTIAIGGLVVVLALIATVTWSAWNRTALTSGQIDIQYKHSQAATEHHLLSSESLPLRTGEVIRLRLLLDAPGYPVVVLVSNDGVQIAYPTDLKSQPPITELLVPSKPEWWPLEPPDGTLTFIMLASDRPISDADELKSLRERLAALKNPPVVDSDTMLRLLDGEVRRMTGTPGRPRGIPDVRKTVTSNEGMLSQLHRSFSDDFSVIRAVAVPQLTPGEP